MNILTDMTKPFPIALIMDKKECQALILILEAALSGKPLNKQSNAYKMAKKLDDELPVF